MSTSNLKPPQRDIRLAGWLPVVLAAAGLLGVLSLNLVPPSPASELVDLGRRVKAAHATASSEQAARELDRAAMTFEAARREIEHQRQRSWRLRSYDRALALLAKTEIFLERAEERGSPTGLNEGVPAG